jgi:hypothetical protein
MLPGLASPAPWAYAAAMQNNGGGRRGGRLLFSLLSILIPLAGCGPRVEVTLQQPAAPPSQRDLTLAAAKGYRAASAGRQRCVLAFPLPGADKGPQAFTIYLCAPDELGNLHVERDNPAAVQGFLIQEVGALAGRTDFAAGVVRCRKAWYAPKRRQLEFDVRCTDGTVITGRAWVEVNPRVLQAFEREHSGDVVRLNPSSTESVPAMPTPVRDLSGP